MACGIYEIRSPSGKCYIGSAVYIRRRWHQHRTTLRHGRHRNFKLQAAWEKYGEASMQFSILVVCLPQDRAMFEQVCLDGLRPYYNLSPTVGSTLGKPVRDETREKMRAAQLGKKQSEETKARRSASLIGRVVSAETRAKISASAGWTHSDESKEKMRGRQFSAEHRGKLREVAMGKARNTKPHSEATRAVLSAALKGKPRSPKSVAKQRAFYAAKRQALA